MGFRNFNTFRETLGLIACSRFDLIFYSNIDAFVDRVLLPVRWSTNESSCQTDMYYYFWKIKKFIDFIYY